MCSGSSLPQPDSCGVVFAFGTPCTVQASAAGNGFHCFVSVKRRVRVSTKEFSVLYPGTVGNSVSAKGIFIFRCLKRTAIRSLEAISLSRFSKAMNPVTFSFAVVILVLAKYCIEIRDCPST